MSELVELSVEDAQRSVLDAVEGPLPAIELPVGDVLERVLASELHARWAVPGAPVSIMDGYAVRAADLATDRGTLKLVGESAAGHATSTRLEEGQTMRVSTGAVIPDGADAVVPQEEVEVEVEADARHRLVRFGGDALAETSAGRYVRPAGSDVQHGELLLRAGTLLDVGDLALLAGTGHSRVPVHRAPRVAVLGTGDELVPIGATPKHGQVVSTNGMMLAAQIRQAGGVPVVLPEVGDDAAALRHALERGLGCDLLITTGGISVGDHDLVFPALEGLGLAPLFRRIKLRPGRPTTFGMVGSTPVLALPGNPASTHVGFELLARPMIRKWIGLAKDRWFRRRIQVELAGTFEGSRRRAHYVRARRAGDTAIPLDRQLSGALRSISSHDLLVIIAPGVRALGPGDTAPALVMRE